MKLSLVIPVYNEARSVHESARDLRSTLAYLRTLHETELILVDDGSRDDTAACLKAAFAGDPQTRIISHKRNTGIGAALRTGFQRAQGDVIITTDFDGTHPFNSIPLLVARLQVCEADIVTASPYHPQGSVQSLMLLGRAASLVYRLFINRRIHSWTSLYCAYRREVIKSVSFRDNGAIASTELLVKAVRRGFEVAELPIHLRRRTAGRSRVNTLRLCAGHLGFMLRLLPAPRLRLPRPARQPTSQPALKER